MKNILIISIFILIWGNLFSQVSNTRVVRIHSDNGEFGQALPEGTILVNLANDSLYLLLNPAESGKSLNTLTRNTDYRSLIALQDISGIVDNAEAISTLNSSLDSKLEKSATTADITESANKNYLTDLERAKLQNTSGTNTGDQDLSLSTNTLSLSGDLTTIDLSKYLDDTKLTESEVDSYVSDNGYLTEELDGDMNNEIQSLDIAQLTGTNLELSLSNDGEATHQIDLSSLTGNSPNTTDSTFVTLTTDTLYVAKNIVATDSATGVKINHNLVVEADGTVRMDNEATVWDDLNVFPDAVSKRKEDMDPPKFEQFFDTGDTTTGVWLNWFENDKDQDVIFTIQLPHSYKEGSDIYPHVHWTTKEATPTRSIADVVWGLEYTIVSVGEHFQAPTTIEASDIIPPITVSGTHQHLITSLGNISGVNLKISSVIMCRLYRHSKDYNASGEDSFDKKAGLLGIDFHFEQDTQGSRQEFHK